MAAHQAPRPWDSQGKNTGVGCHFLLQCMNVKSESEVAQSCPTLGNLMDCSQHLRPWDFPVKCTGEGCHCLLPCGGLATKKCLTLATTWTVASQVPMSMGFSRQEYQSGLPFPFPGDLPDPGIEPMSLALAGEFFTTKPPGKPLKNGSLSKYYHSVKNDF